MLDLLRELPKKVDPKHFKVGRWATPDEAHALYVLIQSHEIRSYVECGTANGYTALWAAAALECVERSFIHTWDIHDRPKIWQHHEEFQGLGSRVRCHLKPFDEGVAHVLAPGPRLYFIDGDHERASVRKDWKSVRLLVQKGDVLVFHDTCVENILELCNNLRLIHGYRGGIIRTDRGMGAYFP